MEGVGGFLGMVVGSLVLEVIYGFFWRLDFLGLLFGC